MVGASIENDALASIENNLYLVREKIAEATKRAGRTADAVRLIAVSKTKPAAAIKEAMRAGQKSFGENYVQEALEKIAVFPMADWHFIGSLQTNKVKQVVGNFSLVHSVDRRKLADEIAKVAANAGLVQDILLEIHIGIEESKQGLAVEEAPALIEHIQTLSSLRLRGLMALPPLTSDEKASRQGFAVLRGALEKWRGELFSSEKAKVFTELSMGTSGDFGWAILEGATLVRVGTTIFGAREN